MLAHPVDVTQTTPRPRLRSQPSLSLALSRRASCTPSRRESEGSCTGFHRDGDRCNASSWALRRGPTISATLLDALDGRGDL